MNAPVRPMTGMRKNHRTTQPTIMTVGSSTNARIQSPTAVTEAHNAMQRSFASQRSAICPQMSGASMAPIALDADAHAVALGEN